MNCQVCGKTSGFFPLCKDCNTLKDKGKVVKCEECGKWHYTNQPCPNCRQTPVKNTPVMDKKLTCIICGEDSNGLHFCRACYTK